MAIGDLSVEELVGNNPRVGEHGEFASENLDSYETFFRTWTGHPRVVHEDVENGITYAITTVPRWDRDVVLLARRTGTDQWTVAGGYWRRGFAIRPEHRGKGLSFYLIEEADRVQGGLRRPEERVYSKAGLAAFQAAYRRSRAGQ